MRRAGTLELSPHRAPVRSKGRPRLTIDINISANDQRTLPPVGPGVPPTPHAPLFRRSSIQVPISAETSSKELGTGPCDNNPKSEAVANSGLGRDGFNASQIAESNEVANGSLRFHRQSAQSASDVVTMIESAPNEESQPHALRSEDAPMDSDEAPHASDSVSRVPCRKNSTPHVTKQETSTSQSAHVQSSKLSCLGKDAKEFCRLTGNTTAYQIFLCITQTVTISYIGHHCEAFTLSQFALGLSICNFFGIAPGTGFTGVVDTLAPEFKAPTTIAGHQDHKDGDTASTATRGAKDDESERKAQEDYYVELWYKTFAVQVVGFVILSALVLGFSERILVAVFGSQLGSGAATFLGRALPWVALVWTGSIFTRLFVAQHLSMVPTICSLAGALSSIPICWWYLGSTEGAAIDEKGAPRPSTDSHQEILNAVNALTSIQVVIFVCTVGFARWYPESNLRRLFSIPPREIYHNIVAGAEKKKKFLITGLAATGSVLLEWGACETLQFFCAHSGAQETAALTVLLNVFVFYYSLPVGLASAASTMVGNALAGTRVPSPELPQEKLDEASSPKFALDHSLVESPTVASPIPMLGKAVERGTLEEPPTPTTDEQRAKRAFHVAKATLLVSGAGLLLTTPSLVALAVWTPTLFRLYTKDPALLTRLHEVSYLLVLMHITDTVGSALTGLYRGVDMGTMATLQVGIAICGVGISAAFVLGVLLGFGLVGLLIGQILGATTLVVIRLVHIRFYWNWVSLAKKTLEKGHSS